MLKERIKLDLISHHAIRRERRSRSLDLRSDSSSPVKEGFGLVVSSFVALAAVAREEEGRLAEGAENRFSFSLLNMLIGDAGVAGELRPESF